METGLAKHQPDATDLAATFQRQGVVAIRGVLDEAQILQLAEAVDQNLAEPGPWANDYTPEGGTGRFFGDYVNWQRIDGYRQAALHGPLPSWLAPCSARLLGSSTSTPS